MSYNDGNYHISIDAQEKAGTSRARFQFWSTLLRAGLLLGTVGLALDVPKWGWLIVGAIAYTFALVFTHLDEVNENVRYVRHHVRAQGALLQAIAVHLADVEHTFNCERCHDTGVVMLPGATSGADIDQFMRACLCERGRIEAEDGLESIEDDSESGSWSNPAAKRRADRIFRADTLRSRADELDDFERD